MLINRVVNDESPYPMWNPLAYIELAVVLWCGGKISAIILNAAGLQKLYAIPKPTLVNTKVR